MSWYCTCTKFTFSFVVTKSRLSQMCIFASIHVLTYVMILHLNQLSWYYVCHEFTLSWYYHDSTCSITLFTVMNLRYLFVFCHDNTWCKGGVLFHVTYSRLSWLSVVMILSWFYVIHDTVQSHEFTLVDVFTYLLCRDITCYLFTFVMIFCYHDIVMNLR